jgi:hypothetical protein
MSTAQAGKLVLQGAQAVSKAKDKATDVVDFAKILFKIDRSPIDVRFQAGDKSFGNLYGQAFFEAVPTILTTGNIPLFVKGLVASSGDMNLVMPKVYGSGTASLNLRIGGYE